MSYILYYSNFCDKCKILLDKVSRMEVKKDIHFLNIDRRITKDNTNFIVLPNGKEIILPPTVNKVPALLLLNRGNKVIFGDEIYELINPKSNIDSEPLAFSLCDINNFGVSSDAYSFLDQSIESLSAKGDGGLRQIRNNATLEYKEDMETPPDDYTPNTIGSMSMEQIQRQRELGLKN